MIKMSQYKNTKKNEEFVCHENTRLFDEIKNKRIEKRVDAGKNNLKVSIFFFEIRKHDTSKYK